MKSSIFKLLAATLFCTATGMAMSEPSQALPRLLTLPYPPFTIETGANAPGALGEIVVHMSKRLGISNAKVEFFPWARSQMIAKTQHHAVIFPMDRSAQREEEYRWIVQLHCRVVSFVALSSFVGDLDRGENLTQYKVGILRASPSQELLKSLKLTKIIEGNDYADLAKMLQKRVIDVIFGTQEITVYELAQAGLKPGEFAIGKPMYSRGIWLAGNLGMPDAEVAQWRRAYDQVAQDGTYSRTLRKYQITERTCQ
ncbi:MAG: transporter substrate-binding domain-containing protein [Rhodoferax sp.]|nr:transporter substrate-binding domain-containing protein [Rhodoferax sp.]